MSNPNAPNQLHQAQPLRVPLILDTAPALQALDQASTRARSSFNQINVSGANEVKAALSSFYNQLKDTSSSLAKSASGTFAEVRKHYEGIHGIIIGKLASIYQRAKQLENTNIFAPLLKDWDKFHQNLRSIKDAFSNYFVQMLKDTKALEWANAITKELAVWIKMALNTANDRIKWFAGQAAKWLGLDPVLDKAQTVHKVFMTVAEYISDAANKVWNIVMDVGSNILGFISKNSGTIMDIINGIAGTAITIAGSIWDTVKGLMDGTIGLSDLFTPIVEAAGILFSGIVDDIKNIKEKAEEFFGGIKDSVTNLDFTELSNRFNSAVADIFTNITKTAETYFKNLIDKIIDYIRNHSTLSHLFVGATDREKETRKNDTWGNWASSFFGDDERERLRRANRGTYDEYQRHVQEDQVKTTLAGARDSLPGVSGLADAAKGAINPLFDAAAKLANNAGKLDFSGAANRLKDALNPKNEDIAAKTGDAKNKVKDIFDGMKGKLGDMAEKMAETMAGMKSTSTGRTKDAMEEAYNRSKQSLADQEKVMQSDVKSYGSFIGAEAAAFGDEIQEKQLSVLESIRDGIMEMKAIKSGVFQ